MQVVHRLLQRALRGFAARLDRHDHGEGHGGQRGRQAGQNRQIPDRAEAQHPEGPGQTPTADQSQGGEHADHAQQRQPLHPLAEQDGDQGDSPQVIDDGQGQQEDAQRRRQLLAHHRKDSQGEGDVGGQRNGPALRRPAQHPRYGQIDQTRNRHPAQGGDDRQSQFLGVAQFALEDLVFDLQPDHEEEDRHQPLLDPVGDRLLQPQRTDLKHVDALQPVEIVARPGRVGDDQGSQGGQAQGGA
ncbi:hypothetical protein D3C80_1126620 [compost metagenome]